MKNYTFPKWTELPEIDLYMDQVITYINEKLKDTYFYDEKFITKAMINNYVKTGIVHGWCFQIRWYYDYFQKRHLMNLQIAI